MRRRTTPRVRRTRSIRRKRHGRRRTTVTGRHCLGLSLAAEAVRKAKLLWATTERRLHCLREFCSKLSCWLCAHIWSGQLRAKYLRAPFHIVGKPLLRVNSHLWVGRLEPHLASVRTIRSRSARSVWKGRPSVLIARRSWRLAIVRVRRWPKMTSDMSERVSEIDWRTVWGLLLGQGISLRLMLGQQEVHLCNA